MEGFLLGISSGTICLAHCAPVIIPYFMTEKKKINTNIVGLSEFLLGRLTGYLLFGIAAWLFGQIISESFKYRELLFGFIDIALSIVLGYYAFFISKEKCAAKSINRIISSFFIKRKWLITSILGLLTGINFCPPFLLAFSSSAYTNNLFRSIFFFFTFFLGTSIYFLPVVFLGFFSFYDKLKIIGRITSVIMSLYFFYKGSLILITGLI